jgi:hypothetical protein
MQNLLALPETAGYSYTINNAHQKEFKMFNTNQIVKGVVCGTFVILALRTMDGEEGAQVKPVNPADHTKVGYGEFWLPLSAIKTL